MLSLIIVSVVFFSCPKPDRTEHRSLLSVVFVLNCFYNNLHNKLHKIVVERGLFIMKMKTRFL